MVRGSSLQGEELVMIRGGLVMVVWRGWGWWLKRNVFCGTWNRIYYVIEI